MPDFLMAADSRGLRGLPRTSEDFRGLVAAMSMRDAYPPLVLMGVRDFSLMDALPTDNLVLLIGLAALLPGLTTILTKAHAPAWVKNLMTLALSAGAAALDQTLVNGNEGFHLRAFAVSWLAAFAVAALAYSKAWKDSPIHKLLAELTKRMGVSGPSIAVNQPPPDAPLPPSPSMAANPAPSMVRVDAVADMLASRVVEAVRAATPLDSAPERPVGGPGMEGTSGGVAAPVAPVRPPKPPAPMTNPLTAPVRPPMVDPDRLDRLADDVRS